MKKSHQQEPPGKRQSPRYDRSLRAILEYNSKVYEIKTINISQHGVLFPTRPAPEIGTEAKLTLIVGGEPSFFQGVVKRHARCFTDGVETLVIGMEFLSREYQKFVQDKIIIASVE